MKISSQAKKRKWLQPQEDAHPIHGREIQIKTTEIQFLTYQIGKNPNI